jgi:hypothetical protein
MVGTSITPANGALGTGTILLIMAGIGPKAAGVDYSV